MLIYILIFLLIIILILIICNIVINSIQIFKYGSNSISGGNKKYFGGEWNWDTLNLDELLHQIKVFDTQIEVFDNPDSISSNLINRWFSENYNIDNAYNTQIKIDGNPELLSIGNCLHQISKARNKALNSQYSYLGEEQKKILIPEEEAIVNFINKNRKISSVDAYFSDDNQSSFSEDSLNGHKFVNRLRNVNGNQLFSRYSRESDNDRSANDSQLGINLYSQNLSAKSSFTNNKPYTRKKLLEWIGCAEKINKVL